MAKMCFFFLSMLRIIQHKLACKADCSWQKDFIRACSIWARFHTTENSSLSGVVAQSRHLLLETSL